MRETVKGYTKRNLIRITRASFVSNLGISFVYLWYALALYLFPYERTTGDKFSNHDFAINGAVRFPAAGAALILSFIELYGQANFLRQLDIEDYDYFIGREGRLARAPSLVLYDEVNESESDEEHGDNLTLKGLGKVRNKVRNLTRRVKSVAGGGKGKSF